MKNKLLVLTTTMLALLSTPLYSEKMFPLTPLSIVVQSFNIEKNYSVNMYIAQRCSAVYGLQGIVSQDKDAKANSSRFLRKADIFKSLSLGSNDPEEYAPDSIIGDMKMMYSKYNIGSALHPFIQSDIEVCSIFDIKSDTIAQRGIIKAVKLLRDKK